MIPLSEELYAEIMRVLELRRKGCTCTPGRLRGGPAVHVEDIRCPLHRPLIVRGPICDRVENRR